MFFIVFRMLLCVFLVSRKSLYSLVFVFISSFPPLILHFFIHFLLKRMGMVNAYDSLNHIVMCCAWLPLGDHE